MPRLLNKVDYSTRSTPAQEDIAGVITACEEQTSAFNWNHFLFAVAAKPGVNPSDAVEGLNPVIAGGLSTCSLLYRN